MAEMDDRWLSVDEICKYLGVNKDTVHKWVDKGLKIFRMEAVRAEFKKAWQELDYKIIISVAKKIPNKVFKEDPKLLMWYDQAVTRIGGK